jgi:hypothetical protein
MQSQKLLDKNRVCYDSSRNFYPDYEKPLDATRGNEVHSMFSCLTTAPASVLTSCSMCSMCVGWTS